MIDPSASDPTARSFPTPEKRGCWGLKDDNYLIGDFYCYYSNYCYCDSNNYLKTIYFAKKYCHSHCYFGGNYAVVRMQEAEGPDYIH